MITDAQTIDLATRVWNGWLQVIGYGSLLSVVLAILESWSHQWWPDGKVYKVFAITNDLVTRFIAINWRDKIAPRVERSRQSDTVVTPPKG